MKIVVVYSSKAEEHRMKNLRKNIRMTFRDTVKIVLAAGAILALATLFICACAYDQIADYETAGGIMMISIFIAGICGALLYEMRSRRW